VKHAENGPLNKAESCSVITVFILILCVSTFLHYFQKHNHKNVLLIAGTDWTGTFWAASQQTWILWEASRSVSSYTAAEEEIWWRKSARVTYEAWKQGERPRSKGLWLSL